MKNTSMYGCLYWNKFTNKITNRMQIENCKKKIHLILIAQIIFLASKLRGLVWFVIFISENQTKPNRNT
jgi:hypothetical protein